MRSGSGLVAWRPVLDDPLLQLSQVFSVLKRHLHLTDPAGFFESVSNLRCWRHPILTGAQESFLIGMRCALVTRGGLGATGARRGFAELV
jgi:hypothetical protein